MIKTNIVIFDYPSLVKYYKGSDSSPNKQFFPGQRFRRRRQVAKMRFDKMQCVHTRKNC